MAASAALCLILLGAAVVLMGRGLRRTAVAQCLAGVVGVLGVLALAGYGFANDQEDRVESQPGVGATFRYTLHADDNGQGDP